MQVMTVVKALVSDGVTIVATIHSPTAYAFNLFDKLMMLVKGRVVYFGAQGKPALEYVRTQCPQIKEQSSGYGSDAEWLVDLFTEADRMGKGGEFADAYDVSQLKKVSRLQAGCLAVSTCTGGWLRWTNGGGGRAPGDGGMWEEGEPAECIRQCCCLA